MKLLKSNFDAKLLGATCILREQKKIRNQASKKQFNEKKLKENIDSKLFFYRFYTEIFSVFKNKNQRKIVKFFEVKLN